MKHSDYNKGTSPTTGDARPVYTTVAGIYQPANLPVNFPTQGAVPWMAESAKRNAENRK